MKSGAHTPVSHALQRVQRQSATHADDVNRDPCTTHATLEVYETCKARSCGDNDL